MIQKPPRSPNRRVALAIIAAAHCAPWHSASAQPVRDHAWDGALTRESGWNAGDIGHTIDLRDGRTLWLFGDSIVGPVRRGSRVGDESKFVRGAIAWHATAAEPPDDIRFAIPEPFGDTPVADWTHPPPGLFPMDAWYWLMGDGEIVRSPEGTRRLVLFATAVGPAGAPEGMWNFRQIGGALITIDRPDAPPDRWRADQRLNLIVSEGPAHGEPARTTENWGLAVTPWPPDAEEGRRTLYVYGVRSSRPGDNQLLLARTPESLLDRPERWEFFESSGWSPDPADAAPIAQGLVSEFTIDAIALPEPAPHADPDTDADSNPAETTTPAPRHTLVLVHSEPMLGRKILVRTARSPEGPWSEPRAVFEVPEPAEDERLITYAAKGHAHLSREGELLITYAVNSTDFGQVFRDASLYRPRFVRVPLDALPTPPQ